jgi:hypothetical protein
MTAKEHMDKAQRMRELADRCIEHANQLEVERGRWLIRHSDLTDIAKAHEEEAKRLSESVE